MIRIHKYYPDDGSLRTEIYKNVEYAIRSGQTNDLFFRAKYADLFLPIPQNLEDDALFSFYQETFFENQLLQHTQIEQKNISEELDQLDPSQELLKRELDQQFEYIEENVKFFTDEQIEYELYLKNRYDVLSHEQKKKIIIRNVNDAKRFLILLASILYRNESEDINPRVIEQVIRMSEETSVLDFVNACELLSFADIIPRILIVLKEERTAFKYNENQEFLFNLHLLHLVDYEILLNEILLKDDLIHDPYEQVLSVLKNLEKEQYIKRIGDGRYQLTCSIIKFVQMHYKDSPDLNPKVHFPNLIKKTGEVLSERSLEDNWHKCFPLK